MILTGALTKDALIPPIDKPEDRAISKAPFPVILGLEGSVQPATAVSRKRLSKKSVILSGAKLVLAQSMDL